MFVGRYTEHDEKGLSVFEFNNFTGNLRLISESYVGPNPSYFCYDDSKRLIYVINEVLKFKGSFGGGLSTYSFEKKTGKLKLANEILIPFGGPCFISMSSDSGFLFVANYPKGSVAVIKLDTNGIPETIADTILYEKNNPDVSHAHMIMSDPSGKKVYVTDLGLDRIMIYDFDKESGTLNLTGNGIVSFPKGSGPRHFTFSADGSKMYVINELNSKIMVFDVDRSGGLNPLQVLPTCREGFEGNNFCADIHIGKTGEFLYGSNRGENTIVTFRIGSDGLLTHAGHTSSGGDWPRNFVIDPTGRFLLAGNQKSNDISVFELDENAGLPLGPRFQTKSVTPACLKF